MEPVAANAFKYDREAVLGHAGNQTFVCLIKESVGSRGIYLGHNPLQFSTPLLLLELFISVATTLLFDSILGPLGQTTIVSQFLGGLLFGPSILGHPQILGDRLFPTRSIMTIETISAFGLMFFFFIMSVKIDSAMMLRPGRKAMITGITVMIVSLVLTTPIAILLQKYVAMDPSLASCITSIASSQCLTAFPSVVCVLTELKLVNTDLGRLAVSSAMFCDVLGMFIIAVGFAVSLTNDTVKSVLAILSLFIVLFIIVYIVRPFIVRPILIRARAGKLSEFHVTTIFVMVMIFTLATETIGQHFVLGPLVIGLVVPDGLPLGAALVDKLDFPISKVFYPFYLTASGLKTSIFTIHWQSFWIVGFIFLFSGLVKIGTVMLLSCFFDYSTHNAFVVGLMMNAKGICELVLYNLWMDNKILTDQEFALTVIMVILNTAIITPLISYLYDPSKELRPLKRRTLQHAKHDEQLRILVCIHNQESLLSMVNLLEASNATKQSPIAITGVILVELVGRSAPMLIAHQSDRALESSSSRSGSIVNALRHYESDNKGRVSVQSYTSVAHFKTMHDDVCRLALDQNANIIIMPFHKTWAIDGTVGDVNRSIKELNIRVLEKAPCTVGILVDRGILHGTLSILNTQTDYNVAVIFIGGPDDIESLAYGARMARHENVTLTVIRFLQFGADNARERKFDNNLIDDVRHSNVGNSRFDYQEEVVRDGVGLAAAIRKFEDCFDLMIVGNHHQDSLLVAGLSAWSECPELGVIGDLLASPDLATTTSVLVVQQQRLGAKLISRSTKPVVVDMHFHGTRRMTRTSSTGSNYSYREPNNNRISVSAD